MRLHVLAPAGAFVPRDLDRDLLLCAGGSGMTPLLAILKSVLSQGTGNVSLLYANRDERSVIFAAELCEWARRYLERLTMLHWLESVRGRPSAETLLRVAAPVVDGREDFVCGPGPFMTANDRCPAEGMHACQRYPRRGVPVVGRRPVRGGSAREQRDVRVGRLTVHIEGQTHDLAWPRDVPLLDVLPDAGIDAPFSCREGSCSSCACTVLAGYTEMIVNDILDDTELADGMVLACQLLPRSDHKKSRTATDPA
jgi:3-ketosteroid 9alpha-monooxygenase subunit B